MQLLEDNCSIILCWPLPYISVNQPQVYISPVAPKYPSHFPALEVVTEHWVGLLVLFSRFPLALYFTYGLVYVPMLFSQFVPLSPSPTGSTSLRLHCCPANRLIGAIFLDSLHMY